MSKNTDDADGSSVLQSKRNATRYQILVQIAERQPAVSQREIADAIGVTSQAVSDYLLDLVEQGYAIKHGRGRYEVTKEGVDWLMSQTDALHEFVQHVSEDVIGQVEIETAIATTAISEGETVSLTMQDGVLRALSGDIGNATAVAVTNATADRDVGVTDFDGVVDYDVGTVTIVSIPHVENGGSATVDPTLISDYVDTHELVATAGTEALAAVRAASLEPDIRFGTVAAVREAATKGLDVLLLATTDVLSAHTDELRDRNISYEVVDAAEE
ncbi:winged helix-turn-helix transcriptional regulator (plasmid) [Halococcus dombrowskii]|uniref:Winged helix-turn-helix transcriptional regulator n=1 Tax=Halococcus dombrowskii TaxID=179637 RepID=A0AAV3SJY8_HALDO|nr:MarR family transcriptional regulator [Halococcus dombrowskii]UOO97427.1 winged helix-turn-helix transcriptional regulator [Halococcus dombrowskii]